MADIKQIKGTDNVTYDIVDRYSTGGGNNLLKNIPKSQAATSYNFLRLDLIENLLAGETYILQLGDVNLDANSNGIAIYWGGGSVNIGATKKPTDGYIQGIIAPTAANASGNGATNLGLNLYNMPSGHSGISCTVGKGKLEKGHKATDGSPCGADIFTHDGSETINVNL